MAYSKLKDGIIEWSQWFFEHKDTDRSLEQQVAFLTKCVEGLFDLVAVAAVETEAAREVANKALREDVEKALGTGLIVTPGGFRVPK